MSMPTRLHRNLLNHLCLQMSGACLRHRDSLLILNRHIIRLLVLIVIIPESPFHLHHMLLTPRMGNRKPRREGVTSPKRSQIYSGPGSMDISIIPILVKTISRCSSIKQGWPSVRSVLSNFRIPCPLQITNKICRSAIGLSMLGEGNCLLSATKYALRQDEKAGPPAILARKSNSFSLFLLLLLDWRTQKLLHNYHGLRSWSPRHSEILKYKKKSSSVIIKIKKKLPTQFGGSVRISSP